MTDGHGIARDDDETGGDPSSAEYVEQPGRLVASSVAGGGANALGSRHSEELEARYNCGMQEMTELTKVKGLAAPARRALAEAGYDYLEALDGVSGTELARLHGVGPNGIRALQTALADKGLGLSRP